MVPGRSARMPAVSCFTNARCRVLVGVVAATLLMAQIAESQTNGSAAPASDGIQCRTYFGMLGTAMDLSPPANDSLTGLREDEFPPAETANCATECTRGTYRGVCEVLTFNATAFATTPEPRGPSGLPPGVIVGTTEGTCGYWSLQDDTEMGVDNLEFRPYSFMSICPPPGDNVGSQFFRPIDNRFIDLAVGPTADMPCTLRADAFLWGVRFRDLEDGYSLRECAEICAADPFCSHVNYFINLAAGEDGFQRSGRCNYMQTLDLSDPLSGSIESVNTELYYTCWKDEYTNANSGETVVVDSFAVNGRLNSMTIDARPTPAPTAAPTPAPTAAPTPPIVVVAPSSDSDSGSSVGIAVGASVGAVAALAAIVLLVFYMRKKRAKATKAAFEDLQNDDDSQLELASVPAFRLLSAHEAYAPLMQSKAVGYERLATVAPNTLVTQSFSALPSVHDAAHISTKDLRMHSYDDSAVLSTDMTSSTLSVDAPSTLKDLLSDPGSRDALLKQQGAQSMLMVYQLRCQLNTMTEAMKAYPHLFSTEVVVDAPDVQLAGGPWKAPNHLSVVDTTAPMKKLLDQLDEIPEDAVDRAELSSSGMLSSGLEPASSDFNSAISEPGMSMEMVDPKMARKLKIMTKLMPVMPDVNLAVDPKHDFQYVRKLGRGAFATVWEAYWTARDGSRKHVAVKIMDLDELSSQKASRTANMKVVKTEMEIMTRINHPGIVRCYGGCVRSDMACLVLEFMEGGELAKFVHKERRGEPLSAGEVLSVGAHVGRALAFLHPLIIHADLKPQNILLDSEGHLKLTDFGLSKIKVATMMSSKLGGTPAYTAPEVFGNTKVTEKCDIYSLGVLMWECLTGEHPWSHLNYPLQIMYEVHTKNMRPPIPPECSEELAAIIRKCWHADVNERPSATELLHRISIAQAALDL